MSLVDLKAPQVLNLITDASCDEAPGGILAGWLEDDSSSRESACCSEIEFVLERSSTSSDSIRCSSSSTPDSSEADALSVGEAGDICQRESHVCITQDGWRLHISHVFDPTAEAADTPRPQHPVLLVPGLASSGEHTFDLLPDYSLVNALVARGYDVWVADLRGNGHSQKPCLFDRSTWWTVDDHLQHDVPAVLQYVLQATGARQLHWIGHSMGGMLAVGLLSQQGPFAAALRSVTLLASGCFGRGSWHSILAPLITRLTGYGFPAGLVCAAVGSLVGSAAALWFVEALFYMPCNMPQACARKLMTGCFRYIPVGVIRQFLGSLNSKQGLTSCDSSFRYADPEVLSSVQVPVLGLNGSWDLFCPAVGGRQTVQLFGSEAKQFVCLGPQHGTSKRHYGHFDIVSGKHAAEEVYPHIMGWLQQHDAPL